jgi:hypothetical protein
MAKKCSSVALRVQQKSAVRLHGIVPIAASSFGMFVRQPMGFTKQIAA